MATTTTIVKRRRYRYRRRRYWRTFRRNRFFNIGRTVAPSHVNCDFVVYLAPQPDPAVTGKYVYMMGYAPTIAYGIAKNMWGFLMLAHGFESLGNIFQHMRVYGMAIQVDCLVSNGTGAESSVLLNLSIKDGSSPTATIPEIVGSPLSFIIPNGTTHFRKYFSRRDLSAAPGLGSGTYISFAQAADDYSSSPKAQFYLNIRSFGEPTTDSAQYVVKFTYYLECKGFDV